MTPYAELLGLSEEPGAFTPTLMLPFGDHLIGRPDFLHGGAIGGLLEMAAIAALKQALADNAVGFKPINLTVDYMRGSRDKPTRARGNVTRLGSRFASVEATAWQDEPGRARVNFLLVR